VALRAAVEHLCDFIESHGVWVEGPFRQPGASGEVQALALLVTVHPELLHDNYLLERAGIHSVTSCLKVLLSVAPLLPEAVLQERTETELETLIKHSTSADRAHILHRVLAMAVKLTACPVTKMDAHALSVCFATALIDGRLLESFSSAATMATGQTALSRNVAALIAGYRRFYPGSYERITEPSVQAKARCKMLSEEEWFQLTSKYSLIVAVHPGDYVIRTDEPNPNLYRVRSGKIGVFTEENVRVGEAGAGAVLGLFSTFDPNSRSVVSCKCEVAGEICVFRHEDLLVLRDKNPALKARLYTHLALEMTNWLMLKLHGDSERDGALSPRPVAKKNFKGMPEIAVSVPGANANTVVRAKGNGLWGSLIISTQSIAFHGSFLGMSRSTVFVRETVEHTLKSAGDKAFVLTPKDANMKPLKLSFSSEADLNKASQAIAAVFESAKSIDELKLSQSSVTDIVNFQFASVVTQDFHQYGPNCLDCRQGERVVLSERKGTWAVATTVDRKPNACGWVPLAIIADTSVHTSESKVLGNIVQDAIERGGRLGLLFFF
jgi:CRP-like cAMP-binding protein